MVRLHWIAVGALVAMLVGLACRSSDVHPEPPPPEGRVDVKPFLEAVVDPHFTVEQRRLLGAGRFAEVESDQQCRDCRRAPSADRPAPKAR